MLRCSTL